MFIVIMIASAMTTGKIIECVGYRIKFGGSICCCSDAFTFGFSILIAAGFDGIGYVLVILDIQYGLQKMNSIQIKP